MQAHPYYLTHDLPTRPGEQRPIQLRDEKVRADLNQLLRGLDKKRKVFVLLERGQYDGLPFYPDQTREFCKRFAAENFVSAEALYLAIRNLTPPPEEEALRAVYEYHGILEDQEIAQKGLRYLLESSDSLFRSLGLWFLENLSSYHLLMVNERPPYEAWVRTMSSLIWHESVGYFLGAQRPADAIAAYGFHMRNIASSSSLRDDALEAPLAQIEATAKDGYVIIPRGSRHRRGVTRVLRRLGLEIAEHGKLHDNLSTEEIVLATTFPVKFDEPGYVATTRALIKMLVGREATENDVRILDQLSFKVLQEWSSRIALEPATLSADTLSWIRRHAP